MGVPRDTLLIDAPYWRDQAGDVWMGLPDGGFIMVSYNYGSVRWVGAEPATLRSLKGAGIELAQPMAYTQAMVTILLGVVTRFESALRQQNLI